MKKVQETQPVRPLSLRIRDAKIEICASITRSAQKHNISYSVLELILSDVLHQVQDGARNEVEQAQLTYNQQIAELQKIQNKEE